jgi:hypothetical protein
VYLKRQTKLNVIQWFVCFDLMFGTCRVGGLISFEVSRCIDYTQHVNLFIAKFAPLSSPFYFK